MSCGLGEEERTRIGKKKKKKSKKKNKRKKPYHGQKWVGWDERVSLRHMTVLNTFCRT